MTSPAGGTTSYVLDGHDRVTGSVSPSGVYSSAPPDLGGRVPVTKLVDRDAQGNPHFVYRWSEQQYDQAGRVIKEIRKLFASPLPVVPPPDSTAGRGGDGRRAPEQEGRPPRNGAKRRGAGHRQSRVRLNRFYAAAALTRRGTR